MSRVTLVPAQAAYLRKLKQNAEQAQLALETGMRSIGLAGGDGDGVRFELDGPAPFVEMTTEAPPAPPAS